MHKARRTRKPGRPLFSVPQILAWADAYHAGTGQWPQSQSGPLSDLLGESWRRVDSALRLGLRGLPGGSSLAQLLAEHRGVRNTAQLPPLRVARILAWADAHHERTGTWPTAEAGVVHGAPEETWRAVDVALRVGVRGLPGGSSLARLLARRRGARNLQRLPPMTEENILAWADAHHRRTGEWPMIESGPIPEAPGETWAAVAAALGIGRRGLPGGSSLARLLAARRRVPPAGQPPPLTIGRIRAWARAHRRRTGAWPHGQSGPVFDSPGETWRRVSVALRAGLRGLAGGQTLAAVLTGRLPDATDSNRRPLTEVQVLAWADAHHGRTGNWPHSRSGSIHEAPGETWRMVDNALRLGRRGLRGAQTLVGLLVERQRWRTRPYLPPLRRRQILAWADAHRRRTGAWPTPKSGPIPEAPGETWRLVDDSLRRGGRGLRGRTCLARLLAAARGVRNRTNLPPLTCETILAWAEAHFRRTGAWPNSNSGPVADAPDETWRGVNLALRNGHRRLAGGWTLARLLAERRGVRNRTSLPRITRAQIRSWARAHFRRTGTWPNQNSGLIPEAPGQTWKAVDLALRNGHRGLPPGSSLKRLLQRAART